MGTKWTPKKIMIQTIEHWVQKKNEIIEHAGFSVTDGEIQKAVIALMDDGYHPNDLSLELVSLYTQA